MLIPFLLITLLTDPQDQENTIMNSTIYRIQILTKKKILGA